MPGELAVRDLRRLPSTLERTLGGAEEPARYAAERLVGRFVYSAGMGTGYRSSLLFRMGMVRLSGGEVVASPIEELPGWLPERPRPSALVVFSTTGEDEMDAVMEFRRRLPSSPVISVIDSPGSTLHRSSDAALLTAAPGGGFPSNFPAESLVGILLAYKVREVREEPPIPSLEREISRFPRTADEAVSMAEVASADWAGELRPYHVGFVVGGGATVPAALEGSHLISQAGRVFFRGYSMREFMTGPYRLLGPETPLILVGEVGGEVQSAADRYGSPVVRVGPGGDIPTPRVGDDLIAGVVHYIPLAELAIRLALERGVDPDSSLGLRVMVDEELVDDI